ncbi:MAG: GNAT family N-acetyltransferase [Lachnospiraceae bacterium]|nr:GNAT family N-acetyltransferase [Lachnospiraceae bacterium]
MVRLRELERKDINEINLWRNKYGLIAMLGAPYRYINEEIDLKWYENYMCRRNNTIRCAIVEETDKIQGLVSLTNIDYINRSAEFHLMIGLEENQNKGLGSFAVSEMLRHAFEDINLERVELNVLKSNDKAKYLYEKMGFVCEGERRRSIYKNGQYDNMLIYSILKSEYSNCKKRNIYSLQV